MVTTCPGCKKPAVHWYTRFFRHAMVCQHCGMALRRNLVYLGILTVLYLYILVRVILETGMTGLGMVQVLVLTVVYVLLNCFIPFREDISRFD